MDQLYDMASSKGGGPTYKSLGSRFINIDARQPDSKATVTIPMDYRNVIISGYLLTDGKVTGHTYDLEKIIDAKKSLMSLYNCEDWKNATVAGMGFYIRKIGYMLTDSKTSVVLLIERNSEAQGINPEPHYRGTYLTFLGAS